MIVPTIHLNGSSAESLLDQIETASDRLTVAMDALCAMAPNARDYYPQGDAAYSAAKREHDRRVEKLREVSAELTYLYNAIGEQADARSRR